MLQRLVGQTESASNESWKSLIDEDRLLTRVEILESQLSTYGKSMNEDKLREETKRLMEEKEEYQVNTLVIRAFNPHWHELRKQEKRSFIAPPRGIFYKTQ